MATDSLIVFIAFINESTVTVNPGDFGIARPDSDGTHTYIGSKYYLAPVYL